MQAISIEKVFMSDQLSAGVIGSGDEVSRSDSVVGKLLIINLPQSAHRTFQSPVTGLHLSESQQIAISQPRTVVAST